MKRITRIVFIFLSLLLVNTFIVNAAVDTSLVETGGAGYKVVERKFENDLQYGVSQYTDISKTFKSGIGYDQQVNVVEVPSSSDTKIISYANLSNHKWTLTTVRNLSNQFEDENPGWRVMAAINGDFFDIGGNGNLPYQTSNAVVTNGEYYKTSTNSTVTFTNDGSTNTLIGGKPSRTDYMKLAVYDEQDNIIEEFDIENLNTAPGADQTSVYFGTYDSTHTYNSINVQLGTSDGYYVEEADLALPNNANDFYGKGVISSLAPSDIERGQFAVVTNNSAVKAALEVGVKIRTQYEFTGEFANTSSATGYSGKFLNNGEYLNSGASVLTVRHPRTTVGVKADGTIVMAVIDGRNRTAGFNGVMGDEMAAIMKRYGCEEAYNLDGGGSSTLIIRQDDDFVVMNSPSDGRERTDSNALLVAVRVPDINFNIEKTSDSFIINADVVADYGLNFANLYIEINGANLKIMDGKATFVGLDRDTEYYYRFRYRTTSGNMKDMLLDGNIRTTKRSAEVLSFEVFETETTYEIKVLYEDLDSVSSIDASTINFNGHTDTLTDGQITLLKSVVGNVIEDVTISYTYDVNEGLQTVDLSDFKLATAIEYDVFEFLVNLEQDFINGIYK